MVLFGDLFLPEEERRKKFGELVRQGKYEEAEDALHRLNRGVYIGDFIYGASDGITTTFAVVAGAAGATLSPAIVIILGIANLVADGFSMGASNFLSIRAQNEFAHTQRNKEEWEIEHYPQQERSQLKALVKKKWNVSDEFAGQIMEAVAKDPDQWTNFMMQEELSLQEESEENPFRHGVATFFAFVVAGAIPLLPYIFGNNPHYHFLLASIGAAIAFFVVGAARTLVTDEHPIRGGIEILLIGGSASIVAYILGAFVKSLFGVGL